MRTTLNLDDDLVEAAKALARERGATLGEVVSDLARRGLGPREAPRCRNGVPLLRHRPGAPPTDMELINRLLDEE
jgi:hypothetical protein